MVEIWKNSVPLDKWIQKHSGSFLSALTANLDTVPERLIGVSFDRDKRCLSEMELCGAICTVPLPKGYRVGAGLVFIKDEQIPHNHTFAVNGDKIICITPGQFIDPANESLNRGDRINELIQQDENHIYAAGELAVIFGPTAQIAQSYGLTYSWNKNDFY